MRLTAEERDFILKDVESKINEHNLKKLQSIKKTKTFKDFQKRIREIGRLGDKIEKLQEEYNKFDLYDETRKVNKKLGLNWHYNTGIDVPYSLSEKSKLRIRWDSWGLYEKSIKRDIMMNTFKQDIDVNKFVDAIFDFYKDLTSDELYERRDSGHDRERINYIEEVA